MMKRFLARRDRANGRAASGVEREGELYKDNPDTCLGPSHLE